VPRLAGEPPLQLGVLLLERLQMGGDRMHCGPLSEVDQSRFFKGLPAGGRCRRHSRCRTIPAAIRPGHLYP
jgi:hypothetical protein